MTTPGADQLGLTWSGKWHIVAAPHNDKYHIAVCGAYVQRDDSPRYPEHLRRIQDGTRKSTGTCKTCLRSAGIRTVTVELPKPTATKAATDDENGYRSWEYPGGEVIVYDDGTIEHGGRHYGEPSLLRKQATAMLAAAELSEKLIGRTE